MEAAIGPVSHARHQTVLDGIVVNIVDVTLQIGLIADHMLPIAPLPNALVAFGGLAR